MCCFKIIINSKSECTKAVEVLLPTCLVPDAIKKKLIQHFTFLTSNRYGSRLGRMLKLSMVPFGSCQIPTIFLQHLQNIFDFNFFISLNVLITQAKVRIIILLSKCFALKVIPYFMYIYISVNEFKDIHHFITAIFPSNLPHITGC